MISEDHNRYGGEMSEEHNNGETIKKVSWADTKIRTHEIVSCDTNDETDAGDWTVVIPKGRNSKAKR